MIYFSSVHSIVSYGISFWGTSSDSKVLFKIQKRIIRVIMNSDSKASCRESDIFFLYILNICFLYCSLLLRTDPYSTQILIFTASIQEQVMTYILLLTN
jgi:hypothetical protein